MVTCMTGTYIHTYTNKLTNHSIEIWTTRGQLMSGDIGAHLFFSATSSPPLLTQAFPAAQPPKLTMPIVADNPTDGRHWGDSGGETEESEPWIPKHPPEESVSAIKERGWQVCRHPPCPQRYFRDSYQHSSKIVTGFLIHHTPCPCLLLEQGRQTRAHVSSNISITFLRLDCLHLLLRPQIACL